MKLLLILPGMGPGGSERVAANLANFLSSRGHEIELIYFTKDKPFYALNAHITVFRADSSLNRKNKIAFYVSMLGNIGRCLRLIKNRINVFRPDIVFSMGVEADILTYFSIIHNKKKLKWVSSERNDPTRMSALKKRLIRLLYQKTDYFICQNKSQYDFYNTIPADRKAVLPNVLSLENFPEPVNERDDLTVVSVGRLFPQKNFSLLIRCFARVSKKYSRPAKLIIYGEGPERKKLETLIAEIGANNISLPGTEKNLYHVIRDASVFVLCSDYEGSSNALLEAVLLGLPTISTDHKTGDARYLADKGCCLLVKPGDEQDLCEKLEMLMLDDDKRNQMRERNRTARNDPAFCDTGKQWEDLLERVVRER